MKSDTLSFFPSSLRLSHTLRMWGGDAKPGGMVRYGFVAVCVTAALSLTLLLQHVEDGRPTLFLFFAAIVASAWFGGAAAGAAAVLLSLPAGLYFYTSSFGSFAHRADNVILFLLFVCCALAGGMLGSSRRRANAALVQKARQLEGANAALGQKAQQLQRVNDALRAEISERRRAEQALQEAQAELARAARLTSMGELAANIAHEINQPLAAISANAGACVRWLNAVPPDLGEARHAAACIARDSGRTAQVVERVRGMVRNALPQKTLESPDRLIEEALESLGYELRRQDVALSLSLNAPARCLQVDRVQMQQVVVNIILNALEAMRGRSLRSLAIATCRGDEGVLIEIEDSGGGFTVPPDRLFEPFFTTKAAGMGLGLSICRSIVEAHGGELTAAAGAQGACFRLVLPRGA